MLGAFYLRLVGTPADIYQYLEPLYNDYRKVRQRLTQGKACSSFLMYHLTPTPHAKLSGGRNNCNVKGFPVPVQCQAGLGFCFYSIVLI